MAQNKNPEILTAKITITVDSMKTAKIPCKEGSRDFELTSIESVVLDVTGIGFYVLSDFPYLV
jgi:hypothetical protein